MKFTKRAMVHSKETRESQKEFWDENFTCKTRPSLRVGPSQFSSQLAVSDLNV